MVNKKTELKLAIVCFILAAMLAFFIGCPIPHPPTPPPPPPVETVTIDVCPVSNLLPNPFCPVKEKRIFEKGKEPTTICTIHQAPPPPPAELKKLVYVSALDLMTATGDKEKFIKTVAETGAGLRIIYQYSWGDNVASPYPQVATWHAGYTDAPELAFYDQGDGTWEGAKWSAAYWDEFVRIHELAKKYGAEVYGDIHENCSFKMAGWEKYRYPFLSSSPDRSFADAAFNRFPGGFWGMREDQGGRETSQVLHELYVIKIVNTLNDIGVKYRLEFVNEDSVQGWEDTYATKYYQWLEFLFASRGVAKDRLIACGREAAVPYVGLYSIHGVVRPDKIPDSKYPHEKILISGDGGFDGQGKPDQKGRKGLGADDAEILAQKILDMNYAGYEYLSRSLYLKNNDRANMDDLNIEPLKRILNIFKK